MVKIKVFFHCVGGYSYFIKEAIKFAKEKNLPIEGGVLLYSNASGLFDEFKRLLGDKNVFYLQKYLNEYMKNKDADLDILKDFPASLYECVSTSKVVSGHNPLRKKPRIYQLKIITYTYLAYKEFLLRNKPDFIFFPIIELYDSIILYYLCKELGITPIIYEYTRNLGASFFIDSIYIASPSYINAINLSKGMMKKAEDFICAFRKDFKPPFEIKYKPIPDEILDISYLRRGFLERAIRVIKRKIKRNEEPHLVDTYTLAKRIMIHFISLTRRYRKIKGKIYRFFYDIRRIEDLPERFIYYPLQYTPETSINTPSPFFVDQERAIDLILNAMPPNFYLVAKEHPVMQGIRPLSFYKKLKEKCNLILADFCLPSIEVIKRASLTISVTGTSCLEAFLLGKPSLHLGRAFFSDWIYKFDSFSNFRNVIKEAIDSKEVPMEKIVDLVSKVFSIGDDFILFSPDDPGLKPELVMNKRTIELFLKGLLKHIEYSKR